MQSKLIVLSAAVAAVSAQHPMIPMKRDLEARADLADIPATCTDALLGLASSVPTPPPALVTAVSDVDTADPCAISVAPSLSKDVSAYASSVVSWYSANEDKISSAFSACPILTDYVGNVPQCANQFVSGAATNTGASATDSKSLVTKTTAASSAATETDSSSNNPTTPSASGSSNKASSSATGTQSAKAAATTTSAPSSGAKQVGSVLFAVVAAGVVAFL